MALIVSLLAGLGLGVVFFGGLWLTVRALPKSRHPVLLSLGSFWGRSAVVLVGFIVVLDSDWRKGVACMAGFVAVRLLATRYRERLV